MGFWSEGHEKLPLLSTTLLVFALPKLQDYLTRFSFL